MIAILIGLALYVVLGGADFGAPIWQVLSGRGPRAERIRAHAHDQMAPVWEANHVWLIFVLTVMWTAYPAAFGSIASTLSIPLFAAGLGIVIRGAAYALRSGTSSADQIRRIDRLSAVASVLTPFALGTVVGGIASRRVPVGNAAGNLFTSWFNATSLIIGALAVASAAYMAAVFLAADAMRRDEPDLADEFRWRALATGVVAGALAVAGLIVVRSDVRVLFDRLLSGAGLAAVIVSALAGLATLALVWSRRYEPARYSAAVAVAAIIAGWALAQQPVLLRGLTIQQAAAPHDTLVAVIVAVVGGALILFPSLALLFRLALGGRLGHGVEAAGDVPTARGVVEASSRGLLARTAGACLVVGIGFLNVAEAGWAHAIGVAALFAFVVLGFLAAVPALLPGRDERAAAA
jgi:cytochrome d ubiquinol oxidase subunit II